MRNSGGESQSLDQCMQISIFFHPVMSIANPRALTKHWKSALCAGKLNKNCPRELGTEESLVRVFLASH
jgi:hypothetical protein